MMMWFRSKSYSLELTVPVPCVQGWNEMCAEVDGRHCAHCQKTVVDFTGMTDAELLAYFKNKSGNTCGRFYEEQLDRRIEEVGRPMQHWWLRLAAAIFIMLGLNNDGSAQVKKVIIEQVEDDSLKNKAPVVFQKEPSVITVSGTVKDQQGTPLISVYITVLNEKEEKLSKTVTDLDGNYSLELPSKKMAGKTITINYKYQDRALSITDIFLNEPIVIVNAALYTGKSAPCFKVGYIVPLLQPKGVYQIHYPDRH